MEVVQLQVSKEVHLKNSNLLQKNALTLKSFLEPYTKQNHNMKKF